MTEDAARAGSPLSVNRVVQILGLLSRADGPVGLARISREVGAPKSSLLSLLRGLAEANFVTGSDGSYQLSGAAFELGDALSEARRRLHTTDPVRTAMRGLSKATGETVLFGVLSDDHGDTMTYIDIAESRGAIRISVGIGDRSPLYCTAGGRMLLTMRTDDEVSAYLAATSLHQLTDRTETRKGRLLETIRQARDEGMAEVADEVIVGICGMSVLVREAGGKIMGALIIAGPTSRIAAKGKELWQELLRTKQDLGRQLGSREN